jgi:hypothetical protein
LHGGSLLAVDLELVHTQPLHLKLLDPEPPDDRPTDRQTPDHQGPDGASPDRHRPDRKRANANRAELLQATTGRWGPPEWELEPVHADPPSTDDHNVAATAAGSGKRPASDGPTLPAGMRHARRRAVASGATRQRGRVIPLGSPPA